MRLIYCPVCQDIFSLRFKQIRTCACGAVGGACIDSKYALISQEAIPLEFDDRAFGKAFRERPATGEKGCDFIAFTVPEECATLVRLGRDGQPVLTSVHAGRDDGVELRSLLLDAISLTIPLYRKTKDFHGSMGQVPKHLGSD